MEGRRLLRAGPLLLGGLILTALAGPLVLAQGAGDDVATLLERLDDTDFLRRKKTLETLQLIVTEKDLKVVLRAAGDKRALVRAGAFECFFRFWKLPETTIRTHIVPVLLRGLGDDDIRVRRSAACFSGVGARYSHEVVDRLIQMLEVNDWPKYDYGLPARAAAGLMAAYPKDKRALQVLIAKSKKGPINLRQAARSVLYDIARHHPDSVPRILATFTEMFEDSKEVREMRIAGLHMFARFGPPAKTVPRLLSILKSTRVGEAEPEAFFFTPTMVALGQLGPAAKEAVPLLVKIAEDPKRDHDDRRASVRALEDLGPVARGAAPALIKLKQTLRPAVNRNDDDLNCRIDNALRAIQKQ